VCVSAHHTASLTSFICRPLHGYDESKGYTAADDTWQPPESLHCDELLAKFEASLTRKKGSKGKGRKGGGRARKPKAKAKAKTRKKTPSSSNDATLENGAAASNTSVVIDTTAATTSPSGNSNGNGNKAAAPKRKSRSRGETKSGERVRFLTIEDIGGKEVYRAVILGGQSGIIEPRAGTVREDEDGNIVVRWSHHEVGLSTIASTVAAATTVTSSASSSYGSIPPLSLPLDLSPSLTSMMPPTMGSSSSSISSVPSARMDAPKIGQIGNTPSPNITTSPITGALDKRQSHGQRDDGVKILEKKNGKSERSLEKALRREARAQKKADKAKARANRDRLTANNNATKAKTAELASSNTDDIASDVNESKDQRSSIAVSATKPIGGNEVTNSPSLPPLLVPTTPSTPIKPILRLKKTKTAANSKGSNIKTTPLPPSLPSIPHDSDLVHIVIDTKCGLDGKGVTCYVNIELINTRASSAPSLPPTASLVSPLHQATASISDAKNGDANVQVGASSVKHKRKLVADEDINDKNDTRTTTAPTAVSSIVLKKKRRSPSPHVNANTENKSDNESNDGNAQNSHDDGDDESRPEGQFEVERILNAQRDDDGNFR
jgi:hypothetical protein